MAGSPSSLDHPPLKCPACGLADIPRQGEQDDAVSCPLCGHRVSVPSAHELGGEPSECFTISPEPAGAPTPPSGLVTPAPAVGLSGQPPEHLGRYRIVSRLGSGGFGVLFRGYDDELKRDVAIKVPHAERIRTPADAEAYLTEARVLASLDHPHIVPVFDLGRTGDGVCYIVSKFIEGSDLARRIKEAPPPLLACVQMLASVAEALHYAHGKGWSTAMSSPATSWSMPAARPTWPILAWPSRRRISASRRPSAARRSI